MYVYFLLIVFSMSAGISNGILEDMLKSYSDLVDDPSGVNNYADPLKNVTDNVNDLQCDRWESRLDEYDLSEFLRDESCGCTESGATVDDLKLLTFSTDTIAPKVSPGVTSGFQLKKPSFEQPSRDDGQGSKYGMFKTAKVELQDQNVKKYGNASGGGRQQYSGQKKSLGIRRGVQGKFVPPTKIDEFVFLFF